MLRRCLALVVLIGALLSTNTPSFAAARLALVLGNSEYEFAPLKNPANDAALIADALRDVGFEVFEHRDANARAMKRAIVGFGKALAEGGEDAVGVVYYAGHGVQYGGENYMIPIGAQIEDELDVDIEGIRASTLLAALARAGNRLNIVILDACRNNPFAAGTRSAANGLARMDAPSGTLLAYSTSPGRVAVDGTGKNSPYTRALAKAIKTPGAKVEDVFKAVRISVMDRTNDKQVPWEASSLTGDFFFVEDLPAAAPQPAPQIASTAPSNSDLEIEYWKSIANSDNPDLFRGYMDRFPNGIFSSIAEERIEQLTATAPVSNQQAEVVYFQSIQSSVDPADFEAYLAAYPDGIFSRIAKQRIETLQANQTQRTLERENAVEKQLWNEVKNATDPALVEAFLSKFPDSIYADLAQARLTSLKAQNTAAQASAAPKVASAAPALAVSPMLSSVWTGYALTEGTGTGGVTWCGGGQRLPMELTVSNGQVNGSITEANGNKITVRGTFQNGTLVAKLPQQFRVRGNATQDVLKGKAYNAANAKVCSAKFELKRS